MENIEQLLKQAEFQHKNIQLNVMFQKNLEFFQTAIPSIYEKFKHYTPENIQLHYTQEGYVSLVNSHLNNKPVYPKDPEQFAKETVDSYVKTPFVQLIEFTGMKASDPKKDIHVYHLNNIIEIYTKYNKPTQIPSLPEKAELMLMLGIGLGHHITELLSKCDIKHLCIVETHDDIFYASLHTLDWRELSEKFNYPNKSLNIILGQSTEHFWELMTRYANEIGLYNFARPYIYTHLISDEMTASARSFFENFPNFAATIGFSDDERIGLAHTVNNFRHKIPFLVNHSFLLKEFENKKVFLCGNGPSLDNAKEFIKQNKDKAIIVSCGTSLSALYKMGIKPDFHVELERGQPIREWIETTIPADFRKGIKLLALNTVHPELPKLFDTVGMALKYNDLGATYVEQFISDRNNSVTLGSCNPTVVNAGFAFCAALGLIEIYLFGIDLGFPEGSKHHSAHSFHYDVKEDEIHTLNLASPERDGHFQLPGNFGGTVTSTNLFILTKKSLEYILKDCKELKCYNTSNGIAINGTTPIKIEDIDTTTWEVIEKEKYTQKLFNKNFSNKHFDRMPNTVDIIKSFKPTTVLLSDINTVIENNITHFDEGIQMLTDIHYLMHNFSKDISHKFCLQLIRGSIVSYIHMLAKCLYTNNTTEDGITTFNLAKESLKEYSLATQYMIKHELLKNDTAAFKLKEKLKA